MEYAIDQSLKIYSGGLGYLSGSHIRSAYDLRQNFIAIGMLWSYGYYDQLRDSEGMMKVEYLRKSYSFLEDTGILLEVKVNGCPVLIKVFKLPPEVFGTAPLYLLSTDIEANDYLSRTITHHLYDPEISTRIAQYIVLGVGGAKLVEILGGADVYHLNEAHSLPLLFWLFEKTKDISLWREQVVFTTHTPERAGNEVRELGLLYKMGFFGSLTLEEVRSLIGSNQEWFDFTGFAIENTRKTNAVSKLHANVSKAMWSHLSKSEKIVAITNAQNKKYWLDGELEVAFKERDIHQLRSRKKALKVQLFSEVADQTGKLFDPNVLTMVWARRFAGYKRSTLLLKNKERFEKLLANKQLPIQIIWAGKPYPKDQAGIDEFNLLVDFCKRFKNLSILNGYELKLSAMLKRGSDLWLNTPRIFREASGTSGMTAAMNGSLNLSINDGWMPEFAVDKENCFVIPSQHSDNTDEMDWNDCNALFDLLENEVIPLYYNNPDIWAHMILKSMEDVMEDFDSNRMASEYYELMYN